MAISHINGISASSISHFNTIAKANISAIHGITASFGGGGGSAIPTYVGAGAFNSGISTVTVDVPASIANNDILVLFVETNNEAVSVSSPSGWTEAGNSPIESPSVTRLTVFWKRTDGTDTTADLTDSGNHTAAQMIAIRGCVTSGNPFDVTNSGTGDIGTSISIVGATTTWANSLVLVAAATSRDTDSTTNFSGWSNADLSSLTERLDAVTTAGTGGGFGVATGGKAVAGAYGTTSVTQAGSAAFCVWTGALKGA